LTREKGGWKLTRSEKGIVRKWQSRNDVHTYNIVSLVGGRELLGKISAENGDSVLKEDTHRRTNKKRHPNVRRGS